MTSHHILFTRPLALRYVGQPALRVDGYLDGYVADQAYEGRLQIVNNIGDCTVQWLSGTMPPGTTVIVDNSTSEVVVAWPGYQAPDPDTTVVPNGSFEDGDVQWSKGAGWLIGSGSGFDTYDGTHSAAYTGRGIAILEGTKVPVIVGTSITASVQVQQGASSKGNVVAGVMLQWHDAAGKLIGSDAGNIVRSGSNGAWHASTVTASAPSGAFYVALAVSANRKRQNKRLWVDKAVWNHSYSIGQNSDDDYCLVLLVRDSAGREAMWEGCVGEQAVYYTTPPYQIVMPVESVQAGIEINGGMLREPPAMGFMDSVGNTSMNILGGELRPINQDYTAWPPEAVGNVSMKILGGELRQLLKAYTAWPPEAVGNTAMTILGGQIRVILVQYTIKPESITAAATITGGTLA